MSIRTKLVITSEVQTFIVVPPAKGNIDVTLRDEYDSNLSVFHGASPKCCRKEKNRWERMGSRSPSMTNVNWPIVVGLHLAGQLALCPLFSWCQPH